MSGRQVLGTAGSLALGGVIALLALFVGAGVAAAQPAEQGNGPRVVHLEGTIEAIQGSSFRMKTRNATVEVTTDAQTWFVVRNEGGRSQGNLADFAVGDRVTVAGMRSEPNKLTARVVSEGPGPGARGPRGRGGHPGPGQPQPWPRATVKAIDGTTLTLTGPQGLVEVQVNTDAATIFVKDGFANLGAIAVGDQVVVVPRLARPAERPSRGQPPAQRPTPTAAAVIAIGENSRLAGGVVQSVDGNNITLRGPQNRLTVTAGGATGYKKIDAAGQPPGDASLADVTQGTRILVFGSKVSGQANAVAATAILILPGQGRGGQNAPWYTLGGGSLN